jgi:hypothetical protein
MASDDKALTFVGQIMDAYNAAEKAGSDALRYALECGKHLNAAKADVGKSKWKKWRDKNLPAVSEETERLYRRLAEAVGKKPDVLASCTSIRKAMEVLAKYNLKDMSPKPPRTTPRRQAAESGNGVTGLPPPEPDTGSPDLTAMLENSAVDEIGKALQDADKLVEFGTAVITRMSPNEVCDALTQTWKVAEIIDLQHRLVDYIDEQRKKQNVAATSGDATNGRLVVTQASTN